VKVWSDVPSHEGLGPVARKKRSADKRRCELTKKAYYRLIALAALGNTRRRYFAAIEDNQPAAFGQIEQRWDVTGWVGQVGHVEAESS
jgi:hypothetical protein